jgi:hypothetical protein
MILYLTMRVPRADTYSDVPVLTARELPSEAVRRTTPLRAELSGRKSMKYPQL